MRGESPLWRPAFVGLKERGGMRTRQPIWSARDITDRECGRRDGRVRVIYIGGRECTDAGMHSLQLSRVPQFLFGALAVAARLPRESPGVSPAAQFVSLGDQTRNLPGSAELFGRQCR